MFTGGTGNGDGAVMTCAIDGCGDDPIVLASGQNGPQAIAVDATFVYWTTQGPGASPSESPAPPGAAGRAHPRWQ